MACVELKINKSAKYIAVIQLHAVSYTHLDVYKRQEYNNVFEELVSEVDTVKISNENTEEFLECDYEKMCIRDRRSS